MVLCAIVGCGSKSGRDKGIYFARIPEVVNQQSEDYRKLTELRRNGWISAISRDDLTETQFDRGDVRVCGKHFHSGRASKSWDRYNIDWIPTLNLGHNKGTGEHNVEHLEAAAQRTDRTKVRELKRDEYIKKQEEERERKLEEIEAKRARLDEPGLEISDIEFEDNSRDASVQTEEFDYLFVSPTPEDKPYDEREFAQSEEKVQFYTGLPSFGVLISVFNFVAPHVTRNSLVLTKFQEFALTLMKLKLNMPMQDLAYRFNVSVSTISRAFFAWMVVLDIRLQPHISWPERESLWRTMPECFKYSFGTKTTVIIDCFEVFIDRPSNLMARAQTFSSYKHHNTVKVLIGVTPQGSISFVSKAWGGRTSDKYLTENCNILKNLLPGDLVLADRGFTIDDMVVFHGAKLAIPAFTKGKEQLDPIDVERTRGIANVRIHVERVIGLLRRKYTILSGTLPIDFLKCNPKGSQEARIPMIDRIITVCAALTNFCPGIVPFD